MRTVSGSLRWVTNLDVPGRLRSRSVWISASTSGMPGGHPSITQPIAGPWLSPKVVTRKMWPKLLYDIVTALLVAEAGVRPHGQAQQPGIGHVVAQCLFRRKVQIMRADQHARQRMA